MHNATASHETEPAAILAEGTYFNGRLLREKLAVRYLEQGWPSIPP